MKPEITEKADSFISWHDLSYGLWAVCAACGYGVVKFLRWFLIREINTFQKQTIDEAREGIANDIKLSESRIEEKLLKRDGKLEELSSCLSSYKKKKHDIDNENAGLKGTINICNEALDKAKFILDKYEDKES